jgi:hypothetical protein
MVLDRKGVEIKLGDTVNHLGRQRGVVVEIIEGVNPHTGVDCGNGFTQWIPHIDITVEEENKNV